MSDTEAYMIKKDKVDTKNHQKFAQQTKSMFKKMSKLKEQICFKCRKLGQDDCKGNCPIKAII